MSQRGQGSGFATQQSSGIEFSNRELIDLGAAWLALGVAFTLFLYRGAAFRFGGDPGVDTFGGLVGPFVRSLLTVGVAFLLHELAHKVIAVRFGQVAGFRADYGMLGLAIAAGLAGFLFAAPGAVYHRGMITERENGLIALAGPVTNLVLAVVFFPLAFLPEPVAGVGVLGVRINLLLAAFNMLPWGPLDGRKVLSWHKGVFAAVFVTSAGLGLIAFIL